MDTEFHDETRILYGHSVADDEPPFPMHSYLSTDNEQGWIQREFFSFHAHEIKFLDFLDDGSTMISMDAVGQMALWICDKQYWTDYLWYIPAKKYAIDCDDFRLEPLNEFKEFYFDNVVDKLSPRLYYQNLKNSEGFDDLLLWNKQNFSQKDQKFSYSLEHDLLREEIYLPVTENSPFSTSNKVHCQVLRFDTSGALTQHYEQIFLRKRV